MDDFATETESYSAGSEREIIKMITTVVVVDGLAAVRQMVAPALGADYQVVAEAGTGVEAMQILQTVMPRVVILDLVLPELSGLNVLQYLVGLERGPRVVIFSATRHEDLVVEALRLRPHGYVHRGNTFGTLITALETVVRGGTYFCPFATDAFDSRRGQGVSGWDDLSERERTVAQLVAEGLSSKGVARRLNLSPKTVEHYRSKVMQKLGCREVTALTRYAVRRGLVALE